jgi:protoporphyrinogen oxidase
VWGVPCTELRAEWAAQRIKGLSFFSAAKAAFFGNRGNKIKSLIGQFHYPRYGPGQLWDAMAREIEKRGGEVRLNATAERIVLNDDGKTVKHVIVNGEPIEPLHVISSLPLRTAVGITEPAPDSKVQEAAKGLRYRDFLTVGLVIDGKDLFPDNWIYIHEPGVRVGRIQNYRSWSPWMVPDESKACVGLEYFCFEGDDLWTMSDEDLVKLATRELGQLGLVDPSKVEKGYAVRVPKAYPMYDAEYAERVDVIKDWLAGIDNLHQVGRNGLHRYNNSDHSSLTAIRTVENICDGTDHDIWAVNAESVYHEEDSSHTDEYQPYKEDKIPEPPSMEKPLADVSSNN